jgi:hypothetical protein
MEPKRKSSDEPRPAASTPVPKKRFRIDKLEERIAPAKGGNSKGSGGGFGGGSSGSGSLTGGSAY